jgi:hypothetical protein
MQAMRKKIKEIVWDTIPVVPEEKSILVSASAD